MDGSNGRERHHMVHSEIDVEGYNEGGPTRTPLATSRAQSPYTRHPTIDFDGLSWPSRGTLQRKEATKKEKEERLAKLSGFGGILMRPGGASRKGWKSQLILRKWTVDQSAVRVHWS